MGAFWCYCGGTSDYFFKVMSTEKGSRGLKENKEYFCFQEPGDLQKQGAISLILILGKVRA